MQWKSKRRVLRDESFPIKLNFFRITFFCYCALNLFNAVNHCIWHSMQSVEWNIKNCRAYAKECCVDPSTLLTDAKMKRERKNCINDSQKNVLTIITSMLSINFILFRSSVNSFHFWGICRAGIRFDIENFMNAPGNK